MGKGQWVCNPPQWWRRTDRKNTQDTSACSDKMVVCWSSRGISEAILSHCIESNPNLHQHQWLEISPKQNRLRFAITDETRCGLLWHVVPFTISLWLSNTALQMAPRRGWGCQEPWLSLPTDPGPILLIVQRSWEAENPDLSELIQRLQYQSSQAVRWEQTKAKAEEWLIYGRGNHKPCES